MKIAITGGAGFIGRWVLEAINTEKSITVLGRNKDRKNVIVGDNEFEYLSTDYSEHDLLNKLKGHNALIHLAATRVGVSDFEPYLENIVISQSLFEACKQNGIRNIVSLSSISVYSDINRIPWREDDYVAPISFYGISKVTVEKLAEYYNKTQSMYIKSLRVARVVGHGERTGFMLMNFINQAFNKETLKVYGTGSGAREYIYVRDVADAILHSLSSEKKAGIFNVGTGGNISHYKLAELINEVFDNQHNIKLVREIAEDSSVFLMDSQKTKGELAWIPKWTLEEGLREIRDIMIKGDIKSGR